MEGYVQYELDLISHRVDGQLIEQRKLDGYINATAMCKVAGKLFADYARIGPTRAFLGELSSDMGIPISDLIQSVRGGGPTIQGTWVHPNVAINLAQWLSPRFSVQVTKWVYDWISGGTVRSTHRMPYHLRRYVQNRRNVPEGHFSVLIEMTQAIIAPMEDEGYTLPERMLPDISQGRMFCGFLRDEVGIDTDRLPTYDHHFEDGRVVPAKAYPERFLPHFRQHLREVWLPRRAESYFRQRDPRALPYLPRLLPRPRRPR
jgi:hypothetical protein